MNPAREQFDNGADTSSRQTNAQVAGITRILIVDDDEKIPPNRTLTTNRQQDPPFKVLWRIRASRSDRVPECA
jgi:hypothetical protein